MHLKLRRYYYLLLCCAAINGLVAVVLGAYSTHGLSLAPADMSKVLLASQYQLLHAVLLVSISFYGIVQQQKSYLFLGFSFLVGIGFFSGGLYLKVFFNSLLGVMIPIGGAILILSWTSLFILALFYSISVESVDER